MKIDIDKSSTNIKVFRENQRIAEKFKIKKKLNINYPVYEYYKAMSFRHYGDYIIEYIDKDTDKVLASCKFEEGNPKDGITLKNYESIITIKRYIDGNESEMKETHAADLLNTLSNF